MQLEEAWRLFWQQVVATGSLQWLVLLLGVTEVLFARANNIWLYPTGIAGTGLSVYLLYRSGLYAECLLNGYYIVMSIYGWWYWIHGRSKAPPGISSCTRKQWVLSSLAALLGFLVLAWLLKRLTPSTVPWWDAWVSATAWLGMYLLAKRKIENWIWLNISNAFAIPLLLYKGLPLYAVLTAFLFAVAILGYMEWKRILNRQDNSSTLRTQP